jgi:hypothetical protein
VREPSDGSTPRPDITSIDYVLRKGGIVQSSSSLTAFTPAETASVVFDLDLTTLAQDSAFELHVFGMNENGLKGFEFVHNFFTSSNPPPAAPLNLVITDSSDGTLVLRWRPNMEPDFLRYRIYRATSPNPTTKVDSTTGGSSDTSRTFGGLTNGTRYYIRVTAIDSAGKESAYSNEVNAAPGVPNSTAESQDLVPTVYSLSQNYPNPFNPSTVIRYGLPEQSSVTLRVYDMLGRTVATLVEADRQAGYHQVTWNAGVPSGIYFYRLVAVSLGGARTSFEEHRKMILLK